MASTLFPEVRVGDPVRHESLSVFPLYSGSDEPTDPVAYVLSDEAIASGAVRVEEVSESGSVPNLRVVNDSPSRVLFLEGEELQGAKQNRVLNTTVLVAAGATTTIPVSCVEQGRWRYRGRHFQASGSHSSSKLRYLLKRSTSESLQAGAGYASDQMAVWNEVSRAQRAHGADSETAAMADTFAARREAIGRFREALGYPEGAIGVAVAVGPKVVAVDVFDKAATCRKVWARLLTGVVLDALEAPDAAEVAQPADVAALLDRLRQAPWEPAPAVGEGQELRAAPEPTTHASALVVEGALLHGSALVEA
jgi:hypothetical protein